MPDNIDRFNLIAVTLFSRLHSEFPTPISIDPQELGSSAIPPEVDEETAFAFGAEAYSAISWLEEEHYIRIGARTLSGDLHQVRLTEKAMALLGLTPASISQSQPKASFIVRMKSILANAGEKAATDATKTLLNELFAASLRFAGSAGQSLPGVVT